MYWIAKLFEDDAQPSSLVNWYRIQLYLQSGLVCLLCRVPSFFLLHSFPIQRLSFGAQPAGVEISKNFRIGWGRSSQARSHDFVHEGAKCQPSMSPMYPYQKWKTPRIWPTSFWFRPISFIFSCFYCKILFYFSSQDHFQTPRNGQALPGLITIQRKNRHNMHQKR